MSDWATGFGIANLQALWSLVWCDQEPIFVDCNSAVAEPEHTSVSDPTVDVVLDENHHLNGESILVD